ncbi:MAG: hypothetical protein IKW87_00295 [Ruminococcus sp.]|nr:hypothetical protein [Ruminococcus sp.]
MMDYKQMAEIVTREVDARLERNRKRTAVIKRVSLMASGLCAALIVCLGIWRSNDIKGAFRRGRISPPNDSVIIETSTTELTADNTVIIVTTTTVPVTTQKQEVSTSVDQRVTAATPTTTTRIAVSTTASRVTTTAERTHTSTARVTSTVKPPPDRTTSSNEKVTTVTTTIAPNTYGFNISFLDDTTIKKIDRVNARLIKQQIEWIDDIHIRDVGSETVAAEWNSSFINPFSAIFTKDSDTDYRYLVRVDRLPEGYTFGGKSSVEYGISGYYDGMRNIEILLTKETEAEINTPLEGTYSLKLKVLDIMSNKTVQGLDCELYCIQTNEIAASWNTSENDELYITKLRYSFNDQRSYGNITYAIRITNLPENYRFFYGKSRNSYGISGFGLEEFADGNVLNCVAFLEDTSEGAPKYNYGNY